MISLSEGVVKVDMKRTHDVFDVLDEDNIDMKLV